MSNLQSTWLNHLPDQAAIKRPDPLASFHSQSLIVAVGDGGAEVLLRLNNHLRDTQLSIDSPSGLLRVIHLALPSASIGIVRTLQTPIHSLALNEERTPPLQKATLPPHWNWLTKNKMDVAENAAVLSRRSARIVLFNHLNLGVENSSLVAALKEQLEGVKFVYLVAAAADFVGANLINDLAVMVQAFKVGIADPQCVVLAFIAGQEQPVENMRLMSALVNPAISASMYEISRASSETYADFIYGEGDNALQYRPFRNARREALLGGSAFFVAEPNHSGQAYSQIVHTLWAALTCYPFVKALRDQLSKQSQNRSINFVFAYKAAYPLRILQTIYTEHIVLQALGRDQEAIPPTGMPQLSADAREDQIRQVLGALHNQGLLPTIAYLLKRVQGNPMRLDSQTYYRNICEVLRVARMRAENNLRTVDNDIRALYGQAENDLAHIPLADPNEWLNLTDPRNADRLLAAPAAYEAMRSRIGWEARSNDLRYPVELVCQDENGGKRNQLGITQDSMQQYVEAIRNLAERIAAYYVRNVANNFFQALRQTGGNNLASAWNHQLQRGETMYKKILWTGTGGAPTIQRFNINVPEEWRPTNIANVSPVSGNDLISALQVTVISGTRVENTRQIQSVQGRLINTNSLVYEPEVYTFNIFGSLDNVPLLLQNLLTHTQTIEQFCKCLAHGILDGGEDSTTSDTDWQGRLLSFMRDYETTAGYSANIRKRLRATTPLSADEIEARLPDEEAETMAGDPDLFARALRKVITFTLKALSDSETKAEGRKP